AVGDVKVREFFKRRIVRIALAVEAVAHKDTCAAREMPAIKEFCMIFHEDLPGVGEVISQIFRESLGFHKTRVHKSGIVLLVGVVTGGCLVEKEVAAQQDASRNRVVTEEACI